MPLPSTFFVSVLMLPPVLSPPGSSSPTGFVELSVDSTQLDPLPETFAGSPLEIQDYQIPSPKKWLAGDQGSLRSCSSWAVSNAISYQWGTLQPADAAISPYYIFDSIRGDIGSGCKKQHNIRSLLVGLMTLTPVLTVEYWTHHSTCEIRDSMLASGPIVTNSYFIPGVSEDGVSRDALSAIGNMIHSNVPVIVGMKVPPDFRTAREIGGARHNTTVTKSEVLTWLETSKHAMTIVGYTSDGHLTIANSFGQTWNGDGHVTYTAPAFRASATHAYVAMLAPPIGNAQVSAAVMKIEVIGLCVYILARVPFGTTTTQIRATISGTARSQDGTSYFCTANSPGDSDDSGDTKESLHVKCGLSPSEIFIQIPLPRLPSALRSQGTILIDVEVDGLDTDYPTQKVMLNAY